MEMGIVNSLAVATGMFLVFWALRALNWVWLRPKRLERHLRKQGFSGNSYRLWFGDNKDNSKMIKQALSTPINISDDIAPRIIPYIHKSLMTHGKKLFIWHGPKPTVIITEPELVKQILAKNFQYKKPVSNPLFNLLANGLVKYEDDQWVKHRKLINPSFHLEKLKNMLPAFHLSCREMVAKWEGVVGDKGSSELDIWPDLQTMTSDVISRTAFGSNYEEGRIIFQLLRELSKFVMQATQSVYIPGSRFIPTKTNRKIGQIDGEINSSLKRIVERRMKQMNSGECGNNDDLLGVLLESNMRAVESDNKKAGMSIKEVMDECRVFYVAGHETTASLLAWTMVLLSRYQNWQQKAREEVLEVFGNKEPNYDGLSRLKVVTIILYEVLRLYPPSHSIYRTVFEDTKLGEMSIPAGTGVLIPVILLHHDSNVWRDDAKEFKPDRFAEGISKAAKNEQISYFPFSWGPRVCIAQNFAMLEAKMAVATILQRFTFELSPSYAHAPYDSGIMQPQYGAYLTLHKASY